MGEREKRLGGGDRQRVEFFTGSVGMEAELAEKICSHAVLKHVEKGTNLVLMGECIRAVYFLVGGCVRSYMLDENGNETTDCIQVVPGSIIVPSAELDEPSPFNVMALKDSSLYSVDMTFVRQLVKSDVGALRFYTRKVQQAWRQRLEARYAILNKSAAKRYEWFLGTYPGIEESVPSSYIASFLGMDVTTLSRIRSAHRTTDT